MDSKKEKCEFCGKVFDNDPSKSMCLRCEIKLLECNIELYKRRIEEVQEKLGEIFK